MQWEGRNLLSAICLPVKIHLSTLLWTRSLINKNHLGELLVLWFLVGFSQGNALFIIYLFSYLFPGAAPYGSLQAAVSLNHQTQDPSHTAILVGESTAPSLPSDLGVAMYLTLWLDPRCRALLPCFYILSSLL